MKTHPEAREGETWVGNTGTEIPAHLADFTTARLGELAYDIDGKKLSPSYYRPLFIGASEHGRYDRVMMDRLSAIISRG